MTPLVSETDSVELTLVGFKSGNAQVVDAVLQFTETKGIQVAIAPSTTNALFARAAISTSVWSALVLAPSAMTKFIRCCCVSVLFHRRLEALRVAGVQERMEPLHGRLSK
jgi:hypothetical protein